VSFFFSARTLYTSDDDDSIERKTATSDDQNPHSAAGREREKRERI
jgi:hypothetical protein